MDFDEEYECLVGTNYNSMSSSVENNEAMDIWDIRMSKLRASIDNFIKEEGQHARLDNLTTMEINSVRPLLPHALDQVLRIQQKDKKPGTSQGTLRS